MGHSVWTWRTLCRRCTRPVLMLMCLGTTLCLDGVWSGSPARCVHVAERSVLKVTIPDPLPSAGGYYVLVERPDYPDIFYEDARPVPDTADAMVYEVYGIPTRQPHNYTVQIRPHGRNPTDWLGGYQRACLLTIPPPPPPPPPPAGPAGGSSPPGVPVRTSPDRDVELDHQPDAAKDSIIVVAFAVTGALVILSLIVCLSLTVAVLIQRRNSQQQAYPRGPPTAALDPGDQGHETESTARSFTHVSEETDLEPCDDTCQNDGSWLPPAEGHSDRHRPFPHARHCHCHCQAVWDRRIDWHDRGIV